MGKSPLDNQTVLLIGLCFGIGGMVVFLLLHLYKRKTPDFLESISVILSTVGIFTGSDFLRVALFAKSKDLGVLANHRVPMVIGAVAIIWLSILGEIKVFYPILTAKKDESAQDLSSENKED